MCMYPYESASVESNLTLLGVYVNSFIDKSNIE